MRKIALFILFLSMIIITVTIAISLTEIGFLLLLAILFLAIFLPTKLKYKIEAFRDNWTTLDTELFSYYRKFQTPRPLIFMKQLKIDLHNIKPIVFLGVGVGAIVSGTIIKELGYFIWGVFVLVIYLFMLYQCVKSHSQSQLCVGILTGIGTNYKKLRGFSVSATMMTNGKKVKTIFPTDTVQQLIQKYGEIEVAFPLNEKARKHFILAYRPLDKKQV